MQVIPRARVLELVSYDPESGVFIRLKSRTHWVGKPAGKIDRGGARQILLDGRVYLAHRLAWLIMTGDWPSSDIDHKDRNPANNAWKNLRLATRSQNMFNRRVNASSGFKNVRRVYNQWRVSVSLDHERHEIFFPCFAKAVKHAAMLRSSLHGEFANSGRPA